MPDNPRIMTTPPPVPEKVSRKPLQEQIDVVAEFYAHNILPHRIHIRTGIPLTLIHELIDGTQHQALFRFLLSKHRKLRRDQRLRQSLRYRGIRQADLQEKIEQEYQVTTQNPS